MSKESNLNIGYREGERERPSDYELEEFVEKNYKGIPFNEVDKAELEEVVQFLRQEQNASIRKIARSLGVSKSRVGRLLKDN